MQLRSSSAFSSSSGLIVSAQPLGLSPSWQVRGMSQARSAQQLLTAMEGINGPKVHPLPRPSPGLPALGGGELGLTRRLRDTAKEQPPGIHQESRGSGLSLTQLSPGSGNEMRGTESFRSLRSACQERRKLPTGPPQASVMN